MAETYDAIIVGAGHNGLVSAAYLAKAGLNVLVLERRDVAGGAAATEEVFPGFKFNTGADNAGLFLTKIIDELGLEAHGLAFIEGSALAVAPQSDGSWLTLWRDVEKSIKEIGRISPTDALAYPSFRSQMDSLANVLREVLSRTQPELGDVSLGEMWPWLRLGLKLRRSGKKEMMEFVRVLPLPVRDYLDEWFESPALKGLLSVPALSGGMPGPYAAGTTLMLLYQQLGQRSGGYRSCRTVRGGIGQLSTALANAARQHGAEVRFETGVDQILLDDERARGVITSGGQAVGAQLVISNLDPRRTFFDLVGGAHLDPHFMREVRNIRYKGMTAKMNLALTGLPEFSGVLDSSVLTGSIVIAPDMAYLERAWDDAKYGRISQAPVIEATIPTLMDPSLAPDGQHVMSITMQYAPYHLRTGDWEKQREALGDQIVTLLAEYAPELPDLIEHRQVITPLDWESEYGLTEGQIFHGRMELDQLLFMRPVAGYAQYRTPFENLYLCGAGSHPGGGVTGAPGYNAAREILRDWK